MGPREADAPLLLDTDAVLTPSITFQLLKAVARRHLQIAEAFGVVDHLEFAQGRLDDPRVKLLALPSPPHFSSGAALKGLDHTPPILPRHVITAKHGRNSCSAGAHLTIRPTLVISREKPGESTSSPLRFSWRIMIGVS